MAKHSWIKCPVPGFSWLCCRLCGIVQNKQNKDKANCPGLVKVKPRG